MIAVGLMSGTSLDGIDAALVQLEPRGPAYTWKLLKFVTLPFDAELAFTLREALPPNIATIAQLTRLHRDLGLAFARAARAVAGALHVDYIASHGQTMWHDGAAHATLQIGDPFIIREAMCATVCYDFRSADCAVGGHGAPLVPYMDALLLACETEDRVALNLGGIANITALPRGQYAAHDVVAFDVGPGMMLLDSFVYDRSGGQVEFDRNGALAARGQIDAVALAAMSADPYFAAQPPKSTGRERFGLQFLRRHNDVLAPLSLEDGLATLLELTAGSVADAVAAVRLERARLLVSGGGAHNRTMMARLAARLPHARVEASDVMGLPVDAKEAIAFALFGYETLRERAANVPGVTGASRPVPLGAIAPCDFAHLYALMQRECQAS